MPGTIRDDKRAKSEVLAELAVAGGRSNVGAPRFGKISRTKNHFSNEIHQTASGFRDSFLRKPVIAFLAIAASIGLANRVNATCIHFDCTYPACVKRGGAFRIFDLDASVDGMCIGGPQRPPASWYGNWYGHFNTGDNIDTWWYHYLDEGQYYYLDIAKYKLLGRASYILGHPSYPNLFEKWMDREAGFINRRIHWFGGLWAHQFISKPIQLGNTIGYPFDNVCMWYGGPLPISNYVIWGCCFNTGDNIDKWKYDYLDKERYYFLDDTQYKLLGGRAYLFESTHWYAYGLPCYFEGHFKLPYYKPEPAIPEPASILLMTLGATIITLCRRKR